MPLQSRSRLSRPSEPAAEEETKPQLDVSPRRRGGLSPAAAGAQAGVEPRKDDIEEEEEQKEDAPEQEAVSEEEAPPPPADTPPAQQTKSVGRPAGSKDRTPRTPRQQVALPEGAVDSDDPVILRRVLTAIDNEARELRQKKDAEVAEIEAKYKPEQDRLRAEYKAVSTKLANHMF